MQTATTATIAITPFWGEGKIPETRAGVESGCRISIHEGASQDPQKLTDQQESREAYDDHSDRCKPRS
jgi:hypothetical protein